MTRTALASIVFALFVTGAAASPARAGTDGTGSAAAAAPNELNLNLFRNPSIGLEYRRGAVAVHGGVYPTIISRNAAGDNETTWFVRTGASLFFLGHSFYGQRPSEFYVSASYLRGLNHGRGNAGLADLGYRWMVWRGLNVRLGVAVLVERGHATKVNPTPGIGWSHSF